MRRDLGETHLVIRDVLGRGGIEGLVEGAERPQAYRATMPVRTFARAWREPSLPSPAVPGGALRCPF